MAMRIWHIGNSHTAGGSGKLLAVVTKTEHTYILQSSNSTPRCIPIRRVYIRAPKDIVIASSWKLPEYLST